MGMGWGEKEVELALPGVKNGEIRRAAPPPLCIMYSIDARILSVSNSPHCVLC